MSIKHSIKVFLREAYARTLFHTGLCALVDRAMPTRLTILAGHCVAPGEVDGAGTLPADMQISAAKLERILRWFGARYAMTTVGEGWSALRSGKAKRSLVALSMDDGYLDNRRVMLPLLERVQAPATVYLESRPLDERRVNWSHKYFWLVRRMDFTQLTARYAQLSQDQGALRAIEKVAAAQAPDQRYHIKRALKYEADPADRDRVIDRIFVEAGGDERALCDELYMSWGDARELAAAGVELGGHTVNHVILSRCDREGARGEIADGARSLASALGKPSRSFAYPWGRRWDFNAETAQIVLDSGFETAVTMHAGVNLPSTRSTDLKRLAIADDARLHLLATEACGGFELLRRIGINLSE
ncbi:MAG TPA: polysaccharide deacetylase family protein [Planctomycetota bacterium]|nr:polysaccharide deacetylase family protein [Planctomycetota bacterium]